MGASTFSKHDLEMIEISLSFVKDKQLLGLNTMIRIFESSKDIKKMFKFANSLESTTNMLQNTKIRNHGNQVIKTLDKITPKKSINKFETLDESDIFIPSIVSDNKTLLNARIQKYGKKQSKYELIFRSCLTRFYERRGLG
jgi:hypothetical protein